MGVSLCMLLHLCECEREKESEKVQKLERNRMKYINKEREIDK